MAYINQIGRGTIFEISGNHLKDFRNGKWYEINSSSVNLVGTGTIFLIDGYSIRDLSSTFKIVIQGNYVRDLYSGYLAELYEGYIKLMYGSYAYEIRGRISTPALLTALALIFAQ